MIEWSRVEELRDEMGADDFDEVVEIFLEEVEEMIARMKASPNGDSLEEDLHFLKGCALNLGFGDFSKLCQIGELAASQGRTGEIDLPATFACYEASKEAFSTGIAERFAA